jgi:hypothetical protein
MTPDDRKFAAQILTIRLQRLKAKKNAPASIKGVPGVVTVEELRTPAEQRRAAQIFSIRQKRMREKGLDRLAPEGTTMTSTPEERRRMAQIIAIKIRRARGEDI